MISRTDSAAPRSTSPTMPTSSPVCMTFEVPPLWNGEHPAPVNCTTNAVPSPTLVTFAHSCGEKSGLPCIASPYAFRASALPLRSHSGQGRCRRLSHRTAPVETAVAMVAAAVVAPQNPAQSKSVADDISITRVSISRRQLPTATPPAQAVGVPANRAPGRGDSSPRNHNLPG